MPTTDPRFDTYIAKSADFAKPILNYIRKTVHEACPEVTETIKWGMPHFEYKGVICSMAAFKAHCSFGFWKVALMKDPLNLFNGKDAMGHFGRITSIRDLPKENILKDYIKEAVRLNEEGIKKGPGDNRNKDRKEITAPDYFLDALKNNKVAMKTFESFSPSNKRDYLEWITEAKTETTRQKRLETAVEWMAEGKTRNWKYIKK